MKIIFLDIDGVLSTIWDYGRGEDNKWGVYMFSKTCVKILNEILTITGAEIILSSDWRNQFTLEELRDIFEYRGIIKLPIGFTPNSTTYTTMNLEEGRVNEILAWVNLHKISKWVAIDDLDMRKSLGDNFVWCPRDREGLGQTGVKQKVINALI